MTNWEKLFKQDGLVFHCETEVIAIELLSIAHDLGYKWCDDESYLDDHHWELYENGTCYEIKSGNYASETYFINDGYNVINVLELLGGRKPFKLSRK